MDRIVVYLARGEYRQLRSDGEHEAGMGVPQRPLDIVCAIRAREDEPQVARAFGQRHEQLIRLRRDVDLVDADNPARVVDARHAA